ncbi:MAG TPA: GNAT family N-acetyltransferase [Enhygromyxa sp.]|nr:GNAT family N-acetyltransferase [Enhygromyxa sp.]
MSELELLDVDQALDAAIEWPDVYLTPAYGRASEASDGAVWRVAVWRPGPILYPYLERPVDRELAPGGAFDVVSPYGYAGAWAAPGVSLEQWRAFRIAWRAAMIERGGIAEFVRAGGFVSGYAAMLEADPSLVVRQRTSTVAIDVARPFAAAWAAAESRARTKTRKAQKHGYSWSCRPCTPADVAASSSFRQLYESTMRRVEARPYYLFPDTYYQALARGLGDRLGVIEVRHPERGLGVSGIFFEWGPNLHLHLVGSESWALGDGAGNLLYHGLIEWACARPHSQRLHVGGGLTHEDKLFYFKRGFGGHAIPFVTASSILDPDRHQLAVERRAEQCGCTVERLSSSGYFPAYRATPAPLAAEAST